MEQKTNDNEISQMEQHVRRLLDKHKKRDEYEKSSSEKLAKKVESDLPELASALRSDDVNRQSKEFTDALNFVLNYRESMEGMHGFIPSSDLAEMIVIYNQSHFVGDNLPLFIEKMKEAKDSSNEKYKKSLETTDIDVQELYRIQQQTLSFAIEQAKLLLSNYLHEPECCHPYKWCIMSDRVNLNKIPLTRCSICGNDNVCDEQVMEEATENDDIQKEFTKEDMLAAFCAAEEYVDFYKWLEQYKPYQHIW